jgi:hypothetical protein
LTRGSSSAMVELLPQHSKDRGSSPAAASASGRYSNP